MSKKEQYKELEVLKDLNSAIISNLKNDLISPLEVIKTSCELLLKGITGKLQPEQTDFISRISNFTQPVRFCNC